MDWLFQSLTGGITSPQNYFICLAVAFVCGVMVAFASNFKSRASRSFMVSLILLPMIVHTVITMVNGSVGTGVAVMGAFSLVRFRSVPGKARDIVFIFLSMTAGLACAAGYVGIAILFTLAVCLIYMLLALAPMGEKVVDLRITVPESLSYAHEFDDLFAEYTTGHHLTKIKTSNMGSLYKLTYRIKLKDTEKTQEFIDKLRCRNGNLEISINEASDNPEEL
ncbi:MAG: DUF4956 domain-containing protein [Clostridia bacterium]|nr:DUF4956 domain-containing protein [Clostridia bacterium]